MEAAAAAEEEAPTAAAATAPPVLLPSLQLGEPIDLVAKFAELNQGNSLDYLADDTEARTRQSQANKEVRGLLRDMPRPSKPAEPLEAPPDFIKLGAVESSAATENDNAAAVSATATTDLPDDATAGFVRSRNEELESVRVNCAERAVEEVAPWMTFIGHSPRADAPLADWKAALDEVNQSLDFFGRLHEEIAALVMWVDMTPEELFLRQRVLARVQCVCELLWPDCTVSPFGSFFTGLSLPHGDLDVNLHAANLGPNDCVRALRLLTLCLNKLGVPHALEVIAGARVPIVKMVDAETGISVDISFNTSSALSTSNFVAEKIKLYPWLRPLVMALKLFLQQRSLNETFKGGVGSYLLFCLVLSFLQQHRLCHSDSFRERASLGHLLFDFFQLYGRDFNYDTTGISVNNGGSYYLKTRYDRFSCERPWLLSVESPLATEQDIGKSSYEIRSIRNFFRQAFLALSELHKSWESGEFDKRRSLLVAANIVFLNDPLIRNRVRVPTRYTGSTPLEKSDWWAAIKPLVSLPIGAPRPPPQLPASVVNQVRWELEQSYSRGLQHLVRDYGVRSKLESLNSSSSVHSSNRRQQHFDNGDNAGHHGRRRATSFSPPAKRRR